MRSRTWWGEIGNGVWSSATCRPSSSGRVSCLETTLLELLVINQLAD
jgi:hypothetical protein